MGKHPAASLLPLLLLPREAAWPIGVLWQGPHCSSMPGRSSAPLYQLVVDSFRVEYPPWTLGHHR